MNKGWISLHRQVLDNPLFTRSRKYSNFEAWIWLLLRANHSEAKVLIGANLIKVKKGQMITSQKKLSMQFKWGNSRLRNFLKLLQNEKMILIETTSQLTNITICNYERYQENQITNKLKTNNEQTASKLRVNTNNNDINNVNNVNKKTLEERMIEFNNKTTAEALKRTPSPHPDLVRAFCNYWTEHNEGGLKMRFEMQKVFNHSKRLNTWILKSRDFDSSGFPKNKMDKYKPNGRGSFKVWCTKCGKDLYYKEYHIKQQVLTSCCGSDFQSSKPIRSNDAKNNTQNTKRV